MSIARKILMGAAGAGSKSTYVDDVFSTYVYTGDGTNSHQIVNGIDLAGEGGMVWIKSRTNPSAGHYYHLVDSERAKIGGFRPALYSNTNEVQNTYTAATYGGVSSLNNSGFTISAGSGSLDFLNANTYDYTSWTFRKQKGFFDVVTFTSTGAANQRIPHSLECEPGLIICKCVSTSSYWVVYHREIATMNPSDPWSKCLLLDENYAAGTLASDTWGTGPTSTDFGFKAGGFAATGADWVAYVFAGGASTAATAPSVDFDGSSSEYLSLANTSDLKPGSGDFTIEMWVKPDATADSYDFVWSYGWEQQISWYHQFASGQFGHTYFRAWFRETEGGSYVVDLNSTNKTCAPRGAWSHVAVVRNGSLFTLYVNGNAEATATHTGAIFGTTSDLPMIGQFGGTGGSSYPFKGKISNFRFTKGQALYTSNFRPSTEPLTTTSQGAIASNVKLLCCNNSSVTGSTVTPGTITANNSPTASTDSPFDDPEGFKFGEGGDQNIVKTGSYVGNGNTDGPEVYLGWEPSWLLIKRSSGSEDWMLFDNIRTSSRTNMHLDDLRPNLSSSEGDGAGGDSNSFLNWTSTGFKLQSNSTHTNDADDTYVYIAIRRPDGYVGKPALAGTDVFAMDTGNNSSAGPAFDSNFAVDFALLQQPASAGLDWRSFARLTGTKSLATNTNASETTESSNTSDYNDGFADSYTNVWQSWMFKRHAGFDVINYDGISATRTIQHSMGKVPEMMWIKRRTSGSQEWRVYHKGLNGGTNPTSYVINLNETGGENNIGATGMYSDLTSNSITLHSNGSVNFNSNIFIAMLFASVAGISKVGYYTGNGNNGHAITTGFSPRFVIIRRTDGTEDNWVVLDTTRGWTAGNDKRLKLNSNDAQSDVDMGAPTSTGFTVTSNGWVNFNTGNFIYYAHA